MSTIILRRLTTSSKPGRLVQPAGYIGPFEMAEAVELVAARLAVTTDGRGGDLNAEASDAKAELDAALAARGVPELATAEPLPEEKAQRLHDALRAQQLQAADQRKAEADAATAAEDADQADGDDQEETAAETTTAEGGETADIAPAPPRRRRRVEGQHPSGR